MGKGLLYAAYGWLGLSGVLHFVIDVAAQYLRRQRPPGNEATFYYGLHSAYSLGQVTFALLALLVLRSGSGLLGEPAGQALGLNAVAGWLAVAFLFSDYVPPRVNMAIVLALLIAAAVRG